MTSSRANYAIYDQPPIVTVRNLGIGVTLSNQQRQLVDMRTLIAGTDITFDSTADSIIINSTGGGGVITGSTTTIGAVTSTVVIVPIPTDTVRSIRTTLSTGNVTDSLGSSHDIETAYRNVGGTITQINPPESTLTFTEYGVTASNIGLVISGTMVNIDVTGLVGKTINWTAMATVTDVAII